MEEVLWCRRSRSLCAVNESHSRDRCLSYLPSIYGLISPQTIMMKRAAKSQGGQWIGGIIQYFTVGDLNRVK